MVEALKTPVGEHATIPDPERQGTILFGDTELHEYLGTETGSLRTYSGTLEQVDCNATGCNVTLFEEGGKRVQRKLPTNGEDLQPTLQEFIGGEAFGSSTVFGDEFVLLSINPPKTDNIEHDTGFQLTAAD